MTSRPEEDDGTKPWKELNDIIYGTATPKDRSLQISPSDNLFGSFWGLL